MCRARFEVEHGAFSADIVGRLTVSPLGLAHDGNDLVHGVALLDLLEPVVAEDVESDDVVILLPAPA